MLGTSVKDLLRYQCFPYYFPNEKCDDILLLFQKQLPDEVFYCLDFFFCFCYEPFFVFLFSCWFDHYCNHTTQDTCYARSKEIEPPTKV
jgi:hypothetical protein